VFLAIIVATGWLYVKMPKGFLPSEDAGQLFCFIEAPQDISFDAMVTYQRSVLEILRADPNIESVTGFLGATSFNPSLNVGRATMTLKPRSQRKSADEVVRALRPKALQHDGGQGFRPERPGDPHRRPAHQESVPICNSRCEHRRAVPLGADHRREAQDCAGLLDVSSDLQIARPRSTSRSTARRPRRSA